MMIARPETFPLSRGNAEDFTFILYGCAKTSNNCLYARSV
jgi:hypothetical protein